MSSPLVAENDRVVYAPLEYDPSPLLAKPGIPSGPVARMGEEPPKRRQLESTSAQVVAMITVEDEGPRRSIGMAPSIG